MESKRKRSNDGSFPEMSIMNRKSVKEFTVPRKVSRDSSGEQSESQTENAKASLDSHDMESKGKRSNEGSFLETSIMNRKSVKEFTIPQKVSRDSSGEQSESQTENTETNSPGSPSDIEMVSLIFVITSVHL